MDISELFNGDKGRQIIQEISSQVGTSPKETASVIESAGPVLLGMLQKNASTESGAQSLFGALSRHDGSVLDDLSGFFSSGDTTSDGNGILGHVLGNDRTQVESALSSHTGVSASNISKILIMLAPIVMGYLGKQSKAGNVSSGSGLGDVLGSLLGGGSNASGGNILSSVLGIVLGGGSKSASGGLGGLLGGLFGKK